MPFHVVGMVTNVRHLPSQDGKGEGIVIAELQDMGFTQGVTFTDVKNAPREGVWIQAPVKIAPASDAAGKPRLKATIRQWSEYKRPAGQ